MSLIDLHQKKILLNILDNCQHPVVITHFDPDGDAVGSALGIAFFLEKRMKTSVRVIIPNETPSFLSWLPGFQKVITFSSEPEEAKRILEQADCFFLVDFNALSRLKKAESLFNAGNRPVVLIDHHPDPSVQCDVLISDVRVSSTAELIYDFIMELGDDDSIDKDIAINLFTGIMTDTGCFSFNSSRPETYRVVAKLLSFPFDKNHIYSKVYDNYSESRMRLMGFCLYEKMVVLPIHKAAYIALSREELQRFDFKPGDSEGFVNLPFSIEGIRITALFIEKEGYIKISFRSRGNFSVNEFAKKHFSGGGHLNAAGGESQQDLTATIQRFVDLLHDYTIE